MSVRPIDDLRKRLLAWYAAHRRDLAWRRTSDPYRIWVSEVMLQQTQVKTVEPYYSAFIDRFPDVESLAGAEVEAVLKQWEGLGYYARARNLHRAAREVVALHGGRLPSEWRALRALPGVGDYIAAALASLAFDLPHAVVDGNVKRVLARLRCIEAPVNRPGAARHFEAAAAELLDTRRPGTFNQAVMELGALVCRPQRPDCPNCPLPSFCCAHAAGSVQHYPVREKRAAVPEHAVAVGVVFKNGRVLITRRPAEGLLGGLWEFPGGKVASGETAAEACVREIKEETGLGVAVVRHLTRVRHAYTHFKILADVFVCRWIGGDVTLAAATAFRWVRLAELDRYPFPKANHKFIPLLHAAADRPEGLSQS